MNWQKHKTGKITLNVRPLGTPFGYWDRRIAEEVQEQYNLVDYLSIGTVLDIGCHIGSYLTWLEFVYPHIRACGIEMDDDNAVLARSNTRHSVIWGICGYDIPEATYQAHSLDNSGNNTLYIEGVELPPNCSAKPRPQTVMSVEDLLDYQGWKAVDLIKIDCEGGEYNIFPHMDFSRVGTIIGEYHGLTQFKQDLIPILTANNMSIKHLADTEDWGLFVASHD